MYLKRAAGKRPEERPALPLRENPPTITAQTSAALYSRKDSIKKSLHQPGKSRATPSVALHHVASRGRPD
jgi:hypothetical protein